MHPLKLFKMIQDYADKKNCFSFKKKILCAEKNWYGLKLTMTIALKQPQGS